MSDEELIARLREAVNGAHDMTPHGADCLQAADRIEALTAKLATCEEIGRAFEEDAGQLRAKLAKAVDAMEVCVRHEPRGIYPDHVPNYWLLRTTLAELKGEKP
jgi:hypothetical protein